VFGSEKHFHPNFERSCLHSPNVPSLCLTSKYQARIKQFLNSNALAYYKIKSSGRFCCAVKKDDILVTTYELLKQGALSRKQSGLKRLASISSSTPTLKSDVTKLRNLIIVVKFFFYNCEPVP